MLVLLEATLFVEQACRQRSPALNTVDREVARVRDSLPSQNEGNYQFQERSALRQHEV